MRSVERRYIYFLYPGGGIVYKYINGSIVRIDDSFAHRNQFSGFFFSYNEELYLLAVMATGPLKTSYKIQFSIWQLGPY